VDLKILYESYMNFAFTLFQGKYTELRSMSLDYLIRRDAAVKAMQEGALDDKEGLVYKLPFKMKVQNLMEENKAYGDRTQKDIQEMEKQAQLEIEETFPSYYDEI
jgi:hypothetical protein